LVGKFRKIDGGWEGYVTGQDGYATLIMISDDNSIDRGLK